MESVTVILPKSVWIPFYCCKLQSSMLLLVKQINSSSVTELNWKKKKKKTTWIFRFSIFITGNVVVNKVEKARKSSVLWAQQSNWNGKLCKTSKDVFFQEGQRIVQTLYMMGSISRALEVQMWKQTTGVKHLAENCFLSSELEIIRSPAWRIKAKYFRYIFGFF